MNLSREDGFVPLSFSKRTGIFVGDCMNRVALVGIMVYDNECAKQINEILHCYNEYIIGRMGIPRAKENLSIISVALDAPNDIISTISGKLGRLKGVTVKTIYSKMPDVSEVN